MPASSGVIMRDAFTWSFPVGYLFGITIRVHVFLPIMFIGYIWRISENKDALPGTTGDVAVILGLMFLSVLLHEFGHCFAARRVDGEADEVLMWPLGGLARCDVPHTPWANFITALGGPAVNFFLCIATALALAFLFDTSYQPPYNPINWPTRVHTAGRIGLGVWNGVADTHPEPLAVILIARLFWANWLLLLFNTVLVGLPFDSGRMLQCALWPYFGYKQALFWAICAGFGIMIVLMVLGIFLNEVLLLLLAWFCYASCKQEYIVLETGGEDAVFGYDFSQGYTSLEREDDAPPPPVKRKKQNFVQRWLQRRAARKIQVEQQRQADDERRMDELLQKIQRYGKESLTDEEHRFLKRVSDRYRNKPS
jgi:Zn-dependent protease